MTNSALPPITDHLPIALRAFAGPQFPEIKEVKKATRSKSIPGASPWAIIFDTETTTDPAQALRFGTYQVRRDGLLYASGIFYDPDGVSAAELETLREYAAVNKLNLLTRDEFADRIFFGIGWQLRATIIGFNLPFDISRIAIRHGSARTEMRGGFSFTLSEQKIYPHVQVKHLSQRMAFIRFAATMRQPDSRSARKRGQKSAHRAGHFVDVKTLAGALFAQSFSLGKLSKFLNVENPKLDFDEFEGPITPEMICYAVGDVQTTWECYVDLLRRLEGLGLPALLPEKVYSEASIGKAYIREMGIRPWQKCQSDFSRQMLANIMGSYFGGRSEVRIRREVRLVILCDFLSMYPTVCTLMGLWRFVIADGMIWRDATDEAKFILDEANMDRLQSQSLWRDLTMLVRVSPEADIFPVRAAYSGEVQSTIGSNHLTSPTPLWFTLADCIAAKLLTGKAPKIVEAVAFEPGPVQAELKPINISGNPDYAVDPVTTDFFKRAIELRQSVKKRRDQLTGTEKAALDVEQNALKIAANATSYGIWVEVNVAKRPTCKTTVHSGTSKPFSFETDKAEEPGPYFHPLLATLITGAARLMLAIAERHVADSGLEWSFCDTDSMAIAKPSAMAQGAFASRVGNIVEWFKSLNPYDFGGSILKVEDENFSLDNGQPEPLYCWAVSAKRYALFNIASDSTPVMRKVSAHGLGHLLPPYRDNPPSHIPTPHESMLGKGIERWHCDLWFQIVSAALAGNPDQVALDFHPAMSSPAISRYGATSPELLNWFKAYNRERSYRDQVKPFGFLLSMSAWKDWSGETIGRVAKPRRQKTPKQSKPIAPFDSDHDNAIKSAFDRDSGAAVLADSLKSYAQALAQYHLQPEAKFLNGRYTDCGMTTRRHVHVAYVRHIGKEAHDWERQAVLGLDADSAISYGEGEQAQANIADGIRALVAEFGGASTAKAFGLSSRQLEAAIGKGAERRNKRMTHNLAVRMTKAVQALRQSQASKIIEIQRLKAMVKDHGLRETARMLEMDASNLRRRILQKSFMHL